MKYEDLNVRVTIMVDMLPKFPLEPAEELKRRRLEVYVQRAVDKSAVDIQEMIRSVMASRPEVEV